MKIALAGAGQVGPCLATEFCKSNDEVVRNKLRSQHGVKWTMVCHGWFMEYVLPGEKNTLREIGLAWAINHSAKVFDMYADGSQKVTLTSTADSTGSASRVTGQHQHRRWIVANHPPGWADSVYKELFQLIKARDPAWSSNPVTFAEVLGEIFEGLKANDPV
ncbi:hypothetical protein BDW75DRAFT_212538 [Aspergillus navahoensis]